MNRPRLLVAALAVALASCGGDSTAPEPTVASVTVSPSSGSLDAVGASVQFTASAKDASGSAVTGKPVTWSSSAVTVATISSAGLATAVSPGTAAITATVEGVAGSAVLTVTETPAACQNTTTVTLAVGGTQTYEGSECLLLPAGLSGDRYRVAVVRPATTGSESDVITTTLRVAGLGVTQAPEPVRAPSLVAAARVELAGLSQAAIRKAVRIADTTERLHLRLRAQDAALAREAGYRLLPSRPANTLARVVAPAASPPKMVFEVTAGSTCAATPGNKKTGILVHENDDLAVYQDSTQRVTKPVTEALAQQLTAYFSAYVKDMIPQYWGAVSDVDGNGKIILFASPRVEADVAAFVWSGDFYPPETCAASNEKELMYMSTDLILDMGAEDPSYQALETLAHETKHVVSLYNRIAASRRLGGDQFHPGWIEEGTAEISGEISSRLAWAATGGPALNEPVDRPAFQQTGSITPENYGVAIRLARMVWYLSSQPNGLVVVPSGAAGGSSLYASGWAFHRWLGDAYGGAASAPMGDAPLFKALNDSLAAAGIAGLVNQTGTPFLTLYEELVNAIALHRTAAPEPARHFSTYDFVSGGEIFCSPNPLGAFPWPVTTTGTPGDCDSTPPVTEASNPTATFRTATYTGPLGVTGIRIHDFLSNGTGTGARITLDTGGKAAKIQVVRLR